MKLTFGLYGAYGLAIVLASAVALTGSSWGLGTTSLWIYGAGLLVASLLSVAGAVLARVRSQAHAHRLWGAGAVAYGLASLAMLALGGAYDGFGLLALKLLAAILNPVLAAPEGGGPDSAPTVLLLCFVATAPVLMTFMQLHQGVWVLRRRDAE